MALSSTLFHREGRRLQKQIIALVVESHFLKPDVNKSFTGSVHCQMGK